MLEFKSAPPLKPVSQFKANMAWMVLRWSTFKIMSCNPNLHPRWPGGKPPTCHKSLTIFTTYYCIEYTSHWTGFEITTSVVIGTDCIGSCKSNYHIKDLWQVGGLPPGTLVSSTNKTDHQDITEILLKVALNTIKPNETNRVWFLETLHESPYQTLKESFSIYSN
jgi:hypothetical protein